MHILIIKYFPSKYFSKYIHAQRRDALMMPGNKERPIAGRCPRIFLSLFFRNFIFVLKRQIQPLNRGT